MDRGAWQAVVHGVTKSRIQLKQLSTVDINLFIWTIYLGTVVMNSITIVIMGGEDLLEEGMATHSSILAWRIQWTEEPGGLQSMGSQRVGHD